MDSTTNLLKLPLKLCCTLHTLFLCHRILFYHIHSSSCFTRMVTHLIALHNPPFSLRHLTLSLSAVTGLCNFSPLWTIIIIHLTESLITSILCLEFVEYTAPLLMLAGSASIYKEDQLQIQFSFFFFSSAISVV